MHDIKETIHEVIFAVLPIACVVILMQFTIIWLPMETFLQFLAGLVMVTLGLMFFLVGVQVGLLPVGEMIGSALPRTGKASLVIIFGFILGFVVTVAEPDVRVLAIQVDIVSDGQIGKNLLIYTVALGVAFFVGLAMLRIILNIPITYLLVGGYGAVFLMASFTPAHFIPISFDAGGVTTGPMTVPFILALGVGVASVLRGKTASSDGFGLVALASIGPILAVMLLGVFFT
ncbi:protein of unknown function DUF1538 [Desulfurispirillum indicum S5]|uniref:DUF1538 domain-containing protein n=1 Tax=Desulfurispirillum indicum (strain ATCC BAA-1389 / DSM 22839 / S5) TaxID=653733 RepID=E6W1V7_DESIS|nr:DUF1538 domain-containing protein [Desulfurispirillum indicum]ADU65489.1 protein of unknown function DUF1538 [Desulfurispirillum indicum S5]